MSLRETYSNFGYYEMFGAAEYAAAEMPASGELSSISVDMQGFRGGRAFRRGPATRRRGV